MIVTMTAILLTLSADANHMVLVAPNTPPSKARHVDAAMLDPTKAAEIANSDVKSGMCRLYAVFGYAAYYPGVSSQTDKAEFETLYVDGTSDFGGQYNQQGRDFAETYNTVAAKTCGQPS